MAETKNLCAQIPLELHAKVCGERERREQTTSQYITQLLMEYYEMKENGGTMTMANNSLTLSRKDLSLTPSGVSGHFPSRYSSTHFLLYSYVYRIIIPPLLGVQ